jgi:predicted alpha/beta superfamily hydrolase
MKKQTNLLNAFALICGTLMHQAQAQMPQVSSGRLIRHADFPSKHVTARHVDVWLPEGYNGKEKYAVLYMHDGQMLYDSNASWNKQAWEVDDILGKMIVGKKVRKTIVVGVWNGGTTRHGDYFPQKPFESLPQQFRDSLLSGGTRPNGPKLFTHQVKSDAYLKFLVDELKPFIDTTYSTYTDAANTFVMGSSMGGLISMYAICEYPQVFGGAACLSTHWPGIFSMENNPIPDAFIQYLDTHLPDRKTHKIYFDYGTATLDSLYPPIQAKADAIMKRHGWNKKQWITLAFAGADHSEKAWAARLDKPLGFLLK